MNRLKSIQKHSSLLYKNWNITPRILKDYFKLIVLRKKVLRKVDFAMTTDCNAKCPHCFASTLIDNSREQMSLEEIKRCITEAVQLGAIAFEFLGGEPLLCHHLCDAIRFAKDSKAIVGITTNGLLLNEKKVNNLKEAGLDVIQFSLDSMEPGEHDTSRGVLGCYDKVMKALELVKASGINIMLSTIATNENISSKEILRTIKFAQKLDVPITLNPASKVGGWREVVNLYLTEENRAVYHKILKTSSHTRWSGDMNFLGDGCSCGRETIFITSYGDVIPCGFIQISYGNIRKESLHEIWDRLCKMPLKNQGDNTCKASLDTNFIEKYLNPLVNEKNLPIFIEDHPHYANRKKTQI